MNNNARVYKVRKGDKCYLRCAMNYGSKNEVIDFSIDPKFLTKKQYVFLLRIADNENK